MYMESFEKDQRVNLMKRWEPGMKIIFYYAAEASQRAEGHAGLLSTHKYKWGLNNKTDCFMGWAYNPYNKTGNVVNVVL